jgi:hypothetical protein
MLSLTEIKQKIEQLASYINAPIDQMLTYGISKDDGTPYIEIDDANYYYLAFDHDTRSINRKTQDLNELLFWVFADISFNMACLYELAHRDPKINYRKVIFSYQLELLDKLDPLWKERREREIDEILKFNPYDE